eukprot:TRINITY_DN489_c0_g2_i9.p1 TRINITY_DN489_c0_g2~~TRINITY_DN489_c0_g2_i9.p1  ORF type:complete len:286 (+),score=41.34 TRINITY_DN489_c0_g2_i9:478-1335(+)
MTVDFPNSKRKAYMQTTLSYAKRTGISNLLPREALADGRSDAESECSLTSVGSANTFKSTDTSFSVSTISTPTKPKDIPRNDGIKTPTKTGSSLWSLAKRTRDRGDPIMSSPSSHNDAKMAIQKIERMKKDGASEGELSLARIKELNNIMGAPIEEEPEEDDELSIGKRIQSQIRIMDDHIEKILHLFDKKDALIKEGSEKIYKYKVKCKKLNKKYDKLKEYYNSLENAYVKKCDHYLELLEIGPEVLLDEPSVVKAPPPLVEEPEQKERRPTRKNAGIWWVLGY